MATNEGIKLKTNHKKNRRSTVTSFIHTFPNLLLHVLLDYKMTLGTAFPVIPRPYESRSSQSGFVRFWYVTQVHGSERLGKMETRFLISCTKRHRKTLVNFLHYCKSFQSVKIPKAQKYITYETKKMQTDQRITGFITILPINRLRTHPSLLAAKDVSLPRNYPSGVERGETTVFTG